MESRQIFVGTSGWTYDDWSGAFYPKDVKGSERLAYYVTRFNTVEINATFYRLPTQPMLDAWNRRLPAEFHLVVKGSRVVTHLKKLSDCQESLETFLDRVKQLKPLRAILWQLPPSQKKDIDRLERFLIQLPRREKGTGPICRNGPEGALHKLDLSPFLHDVRHAIEFRHASWWDDDVAALLKKHRAAFVAVSHPTLPNTIYPTTDFLYLRFHGLGRQLYRYDYSNEELKDWATRLKPHLKSRTLYAFFNNDFQSHAPRNAEKFRALLEIL